VGERRKQKIEEKCIYNDIFSGHFSLFPNFPGCFSLCCYKHPVFKQKALSFALPLITYKAWCSGRGSLFNNKFFKNILKEACNTYFKTDYMEVLVVRPWPRLPREAVAALSLAVFKARLDRALSNRGWWKVSLLVGRTR